MIPTPEPVSPHTSHPSGRDHIAQWLVGDVGHVAQLGETAEEWVCGLDRLPLLFGGVADAYHRGGHVEARSVRQHRPVTQGGSRLGNRPPAERLELLVGVAVEILQVREPLEGGVEVHHRGDGPASAPLDADFTDRDLPLPPPVRSSSSTSPSGFGTLLRGHARVTSSRWYRQPYRYPFCAGSRCPSKPRLSPTEKHFSLEPLQTHPASLRNQGLIANIHSRSGQRFRPELTDACSIGQSCNWSNCCIRLRSG